MLRAKSERDAEDSWKYLLRGLWESALRLDELMHVHWIDEHYIAPLWKRGALPELTIPAAMQKTTPKNRSRLLPGFEALLLETPEVRAVRMGIQPDEPAD